jgi:hypothetical protein
MTLTAAHYVYLAGLGSLILVMGMRKPVVVPAVAATAVTATVASGSIATGISSIFRASLVAASELFSIFLIIALVTAMLAALRAIDAEHRMVAPFTRLMVNGRVSFIVLFVVTYVLSLFFWPTPVLALVAAILLPAAVRAGLSPLGGAMAIAIGGQGMALASDYVIGVAPQLSASGAGVPAGTIADRALVLSLVVGAVAISLSYVMTVRPSLRASTAAVRQEELSLARTTTTEGALTSVGHAAITRLRGGGASWDETAATGSVPGRVDAKMPEDPLRARPGATRLWAWLVPATFLGLLTYMLLGRFTDVVTVDDGAGAPLVGGTAALLLLGIALTSDRSRALETCATHVVDGLAFAFKAMGVVIPVAGFVLMGISDFSGRILGADPEADTPGFLFDGIRSIQHMIPDSPVVVVLAVLLAGMTVGLDGSGWAGLPLTGSISAALGAQSGVDTATLAAIAQNGASWTGGGTLVIWSSLIAVAGFCGVDVVTLARRLFLPVVLGLVVASLAALLLW